MDAGRSEEMAETPFVSRRENAKLFTAPVPSLSTASADKGGITLGSSVEFELVRTVPTVPRDT